MNSGADLYLSGDASYNYFGVSVSGAGDLNGGVVRRSNSWRIRLSEPDRKVIHVLRLRHKRKADTALREGCSQSSRRKGLSQMGKKLV